MGVLSGESLTQHFINDFPAADHFEGSDAAANTGTAYTIELGDTFEGEISSGSDDDWIAIELTAGESVVINVYGTNGASAGIRDTTLTLYNSNGQQVDFNDDAFFNGQNYFSLIEYTVPATGTYYIAVSGYDSSQTGDYIVRTTTDDFRIEDIVSQLTEFGWGIPTAIGHDENTDDTMYVYIANLTAAGQQLALQALEQWSVVTGITFSVTGNITDADIRFDDSQSGAFAGPSSFSATTGVISFSDVNVGTGWLSSYGTTTDSYSFLTYLHEIGHALGLVHSGNYDGFANWGVNNHFNNDSTIFTIMSYFDMEETGFAPYANIITPMIADIAAVWGLYGEPVSVYGGDTTWFANNTLGGLTGDIMAAHWDNAAISSSVFTGDDVALTVLDTGGIDTIDLSTVTVAQTIDLREGQISVIGAHGSSSARNSFVIAQGTVIENVIGGSGNDDIWGNDANNNIQGGGGSDWYYEGLGNDTFNGGGGTDRVIFGIDTGGITVTDMGGGAIEVTSSLGTDTYTSVEFYQFTDDTLTYSEMLDLAGGPIVGNDGPNTLDGTAGDDEIQGLGGSDVLRGLAGNDLIFGGDGNDRILGGDNDDTIYGQNGSDQIWGGSGIDTINGGPGFDVIRGEGGDDVLLGFTGNDAISGGDGDDRIQGGDGHDSLDGQADNDEIYGQQGNDTIYGGTGNDQLFGGDGDDTIDGGDGEDRVVGGAGENTLYGGNNIDTIIGGNEADEIYGQNGSDQVFGGDGADTIIGGPGFDFLRGQGGDDNIVGGVGNDILTGGTGNDRLVGGIGNDQLLGQDDNDTLFGQNGQDILDGGAGIDVLDGGRSNDILTGGSGADEFVFVGQVAGEVDIVTDFYALEGDTLTLGGVAGASDVERFGNLGITQDGLDTEISWNGTTVVLADFTATDLTVDDFNFV
ncbi:M10 family metallopeptidase C-terminal domain-containing protein [Vannielia litorea]|uniref:M10 family metallopeptidase C-terminal domain-containing protein n=1 Tax=Vannielia litorea TaxID=1217970 RepID=UPI001BCC4679|nr:M10 family metallopeptidase C-terminal domain-containing protein [Vannielia litorea]